MVDYNTVKSKIKDFRKRILRDITIKRNELALKLYNAVRSAVKYINEQLSANISAKRQLDVDTYSVQLYYLSSANYIGEKKVYIEYDDNVAYINGKSVVPYDTFTYDPGLYNSATKQFGDRLSKQFVIFMIPHSLSPPAGDFEDVSYMYYCPKDHISCIEYEYIPVDAELFYMAEFDLYGLGEGKVNITAIRGVFDSFYRYIEGGITCLISSGGCILVSIGNTERWINYKFVLNVINQSPYDIEVLVGTKPHKIPSGSECYYIYITDIHLKGTPIFIRKSVS